MARTDVASYRLGVSFVSGRVMLSVLLLPAIFAAVVIADRWVARRIDRENARANALSRLRLTIPASPAR